MSKSFCERKKTILQTNNTTINKMNSFHVMEVKGKAELNMLWLLDTQGVIRDYFSSTGEWEAS